MICNIWLNKLPLVVLPTSLDQGVAKQFWYTLVSVIQPFQHGTLPMYFLLEVTRC